MSRKLSTTIGNQLYQLLPEVYRNRDNGDLAGYLDACGELLDLVRNTLEQRLADCFPESCQDWLLAYFAQLLDVRLVSPKANGQRKEVAKAVHWRQRKGTLTCVEEVAEAVAQTEVEIQEGWKRVATTTRTGIPLLPAGFYGETAEPDMNNPLEASRHPGLPAVMVDLRYPSRTVQPRSSSPAVKQSSFAGVTALWRQANPHGAPCFPGSYADVSQRTVDLRTPDWQQGHFHPARVLLFAPPPEVFFAPDIISIPWQDRFDEQYAGLFEEQEEGGVWIFRAKTVQPLCIYGDIDLEEEKTYRFERVRLDDQLFVRQGRLELFKVAACQVEVETIDTDEPVLEAADSLFDTVQAAGGLARLEYCTVLGLTLIEILQASDCIFLGPVKKDHEGAEPPRAGCIRFSRIPPEILCAHEPKPILALGTNTTDEPVFFHTKFKEPCCAVLHPAAPESVRFGAEDGGEMGAYHGQHHVLRVEAVLDKLRDYLPLGIEAVWIHDPLLRCAPPNET